MKQLNLATRFPVNILAGTTGCTHRSTTGDRKLNVKNDYPSAETSRKWNEVVWRTEDAANVEMDRVDGRQVEGCVGSRSSPRHASFIEIDC